MNYYLPKTVIVGGESLQIRYDFRVILEILEMLGDPELDAADKAEALITMFYVEPERLKNAKEAVEQCYNFIDMGEQNNTKSPRLVDWEQDFQLLIGQINKVAGCEIRALDYLHWWTFISYYNEIDGESTFARVVAIRDKKARGKSLDKDERSFYNRNRSMIDLKTRYSDKEKDVLAQWTTTNGQ